MEGFFLMSNIQKTIDALKEAEKYLDKEVSDPKKYNNPMSQALEILSWEISSNISRLQEEYYWFGR